MCVCVCVCVCYRAKLVIRYLRPVSQPRRVTSERETETEKTKQKQTTTKNKRERERDKENHGCGNPILPRAVDMITMTQSSLNCLRKHLAEGARCGPETVHYLL